jgi:ABC-2 type transport system ATP-binding protein
MKGVYKSFHRGFTGRKRAVLRDLELDVRRGEVFGILGHNGAGKTTSLRIALGILRSEAGEVLLLGRRGATRDARTRVGFLSDELGLYPAFNAMEMMRLHGELLRMGPRQVRERTDELLDRVGLAEAAKLKVSKYSKGMRQRLGIAMAIMNDPELLVLDEPYSGLDPIGRRDVRKLLLSLKEKGTSIVISSHIVPDVEAVCDRVGVLAEGRVDTCLDLRDISQQKSADVELTVADVDARVAIGNTKSTRVVYTTNEAVVLRCEGNQATERVLRRVLDAGGRIVELKPLRFSLEDYLFERLTESGKRPIGDMLRREAYAHR